MFALLCFNSRLRKGSTVFVCLRTFLAVGNTAVCRRGRDFSEEFPLSDLEHETAVKHINNVTAQANIFLVFIKNPFG